jgi:hypothetical protein
MYMGQKGKVFISVVAIVVLLLVAYVIYSGMILQKQETSLQSTTVMPQDESYVLYQMTDNKVMRLSSGKTGEKVYLLSNPEFRKVDDTNSLPVTPKDAIWLPMPNGTFKTRTGITYIIQDSKIVQVTDRNGNIMAQ